MNELSVAFKVISERNCPFYTPDDLFVLTSQSVQVPVGTPSCLIFVREVTNLLFNTIVPAVGMNYDELKDEIFNCGGCTGLIKFKIEEDPEAAMLDCEIAPDLDKTAEDEDTDTVEVQKSSVNSGAVSGHLDEVSSSELMQFFHMHQKTGKLILDVPSGTGRVAFREGAIIGAKFMEYEDKDAIFALLREHKGKFNFYSGIPDSLQDVEDIGDFMMILMEGIKRMDESG